jgi:hypothetical protein
VLPGGDSGLAWADVFYFGNAVGETGNEPGNAIVNATDQLLVRNNSSGFVPALVTNPYDFNRDKLVNATDTLLARANPSGFTPLVLIQPPQ